MAAAFHPLPPDAGFCVVIPGFLSARECERHIAMSEARGFAGAGSDYPPSYRNNDRQVVDDPQFARRMLDRLAPHAPAVLPDEAGGAPWSLHSVNERFRLCRYRAGQQFNLHQDGVHHRTAGLLSRLTFMVYLTDGDAFEGGDTLFYSAGPAGDASGAAATVIGRVRPQAGSLILFDHKLWHAGEVVTRGVKHILRSDVLYQRPVQAVPPAPAEPFQPGHAGYVWTMARLSDGSIASGGRDAAIRLWQADGRATGELAGHSQSVLGLAPLPGGRLASVSRDRSLRLWDVRSRHCTQVVDAAHGASLLTVAALPGGSLATGGADALVKLWRHDGRALATLSGHTGWVWAVASLGDDQLASASEDGSAKLWDSASRRCLHTLQGDTPLRDVVALPGGRLVTADIEGRLATWVCRDGAWRRGGTVPAHTAAVRRLRLVGDGLLASAGEDNRVRVWRLSDWRPVAQSRHGNFVTDALALGGGAYLSCSYDGRIARHGGLPAVPETTEGMALAGEFVHAEH